VGAPFPPGNPVLKGKTMTHRAIVVLTLAAWAALGLSACGKKDESGGAGGAARGIVPGEVLPPPSDPFATLPVITSGDIVQKLQDAGEFGRFLHALTKSEALYEIKGPGPFTVFAPTDAAFDNLPDETVKALNRDLKWYKKVLQHHVVAGRVTVEDLVKAGSVVTTAGVKLAVQRDAAGNVTAGGAHLEMKDVAASNGLVHSIDKVLLLPEG
jgi:hypothetical protein